MPESAQAAIYEALAGIRLIDPHTHINPHAPASSTLAEILGYHYYTELAHSAGMPKSSIEDESLSPRELVGRLVGGLGPIENTAQYRWLIEICRTFFNFDGERLDESNWEAVYDAAETQMQAADWAQTVLDRSNVEAVFLTNDFDDALQGFDTNTYIPCLRTDDLVFHLAKPDIRQRLAACSGIELDGGLTSLRHSLRQRFEHFVAAGARACAISLPPTFSPTRVTDGRAQAALDAVLRQGLEADPAHRAALSQRVFWTIAELCDEFGLPFDLMIGVVRGVYPQGVYQGQDLYDSRVSLIQYRDLFNAFPDVRFPISVLASVTNQELVSYAWIFPNVITNGHWWYSNTPSFIARDTAARLEAVPRTKQIAYYSDAYKLEFVWPKFDMYRQVLSRVLADHFVDACQWSEARAIELGRQVLRDNVDQVFPLPDSQRGVGLAVDSHPADDDRVDEASSLSTVGTAAGYEFDDAPDDVGPEDVVPIYDSRETVALDEEFHSKKTVKMDPLPSREEIESLGIADVELADNAIEHESADDHQSADDREFVDDPLDVGSLFGDDEGSDPSARPADQIRMMRGDSQFSADEDSLQLHPDPTTGELRFHVPADDEDDAADPTDADASTSSNDSPESSAADETDDKRRD